MWNYWHYTIGKTVKPTTIVFATDNIRHKDLTPEIFMALYRKEIAEVTCSSIGAEWAYLVNPSFYPIDATLYQNIPIAYWDRVWAMTPFLWKCGDCGRMIRSYSPDTAS